MDGKEITETLSVPNSFEHHILLYAKGWYKETENGKLEDLKVLLSEYAGIEASINDVKAMLCSCFANYCPKSMMPDAIQEMLGWSWKSDFMKNTPEAIMLGSLCLVKGHYVDPTQILPVLTREDLPEFCKKMLTTQPEPDTV